MHEEYSKYRMVIWRFSLSLLLSLTVMNLSAGILTVTVLVGKMAHLCTDRRFGYTAACHWGRKKRHTPRWLSLPACASIGISATLWFKKLLTFTFLEHQWQFHKPKVLHQWCVSCGLMTLQEKWLMIPPPPPQVTNMHALSLICMHRGLHSFKGLVDYTADHSQRHRIRMV
jgi:hypothetical protein